MPEKTIAPTRSNYLRTRKSFERAREGYELLERKRQILVMELMGKMQAASVAQGQVREVMKRAFEALERAAVAAGSERLLREGCAIPVGHRLSIRTRSVMGVNVPEISFHSHRLPLPFGLLEGASGADEVCKSFHDALELIVRLAEVENAVLRLAREVKRTQRRVNALEKIFIPEYEDILKFIGDSLEERDREDMVIMKKVKLMRQAAREAQSGRLAAEEGHG